MSADNQGQYNRAFDVSVLGNDPDRTRITVDGARINDPVDGGTQQNFSQEIVQEFQISSANFDLSTGLTASGAINVVTRSGSNQFHGEGFFYFRDHNMSAYPALQRDPSIRTRSSRTAKRSVGRRTNRKRPAVLFLELRRHRPAGCVQHRAHRPQLRMLSRGDPEPLPRRHG